MGLTLCRSNSIHQILMAFPPPIVGCLLTTAYKRGGGVTKAPQDPLWLPPWMKSFAALHIVQRVENMYLWLLNTALLN